MNITFEKILSIPKSFYVCIKLLPFRQALRLPIIVRYNCLLLSTKGTMEIYGNVRRGMINIGFERIGIFDKKYQRSILQIDGKIIIKGAKIIFGQGAKICIMNNGTLILGKNFTNTGELQIVCNKKIDIKDNVLVSWDTLIMDTDFHQTINIEDNTTSCIDGAISIGNNVWIGARCTILKNSSIPNGCIIAANTCCNKKYQEANCILAGTPAKIQKRNITRKIE